MERQENPPRDPYFKPFPTRLRAQMEEREATQQMLADYVGVTRQAISLYINGQSLPDIEKLERMADYFNVSTDWLLGRSEAKNQDNHNTVQETGLSEAAVNKLKDWHEKRTETDKNGVSVTVVMHTKAPRELSELIEHRQLRKLIDLICALKYMAGDKRRLLDREAVLGPNKIESLMKEIGRNNTRDYIMFMLQDTFRQMLDDIAPYTPMEEVRPATQADIDKLLS